MIKYRDGDVLTSEENVLRRWKENFEEMRNEGNERERRVEEEEETRTGGGEKLLG